jgi:iron complex transport system ATP-binding protein
MLRVQNLTFSFDSREVFRDFSMEVESGTICALLGPNGCGKTTLLRCCLNLLPGYSGCITLAGRPLDGLKPAEMARLASYVQQEHFPSFPFLVEDVVLMGRTPHVGNALAIRTLDRHKVEEALEVFGIGDLRKRPYTQLSGGQRQLVLLARAHAQDTSVIMLDEPTSSLDFGNQIMIWSLLRELRASGKIIIVATHQPNHALWFCDKVVAMNGGSKIADGSPRDVLTQEILDRIYSESCKIAVMNGGKMIVPRMI